MSKRKNSDRDYRHLEEKIKKLEREIYNSRKREVRVMRVMSSSSSSSPESTPSRRLARRSETQDRQIENSMASSSGRRDQESDEDLVDILYADAISPPGSQHLPPPLCSPQATPAHGTAHSAAAMAAQPIPSTSAMPTAPLSSVEPEPNADADIEAALDDDVMEILGIDPTKSEKFGPEIHKEVAKRLEHYATIGLTKEERKELSDKYLLPSNCKLINAPTLNLEVKAALTEPLVKRDKAIEMKQKFLASAIASLGQAITLLLSIKEKQPELLRLLIDTGRLICDCQHNDSQTRRNYVLSSLKKEMKEQMKNTKIDNLLFGENLQETLKTAKAITKSSADLKAVTYFTRSKVNTKPTPSTSKNWKNSNSNRKQTAAQRTKETTTVSAATRNPRANSYKKSQQRPRSSRR